ncbi:MAG: type II secretion system F family protein [Candidatus Aenigmatarchaeota archaeon]|nr:type II secretion system F family protein [Nanoarchaeota archaeon]
MKLKKQNKILIIMTVISVGLVATGLFIGDPGVIGNMIIISIFLIIVPEFLYKYSRYVWVQDLEEEFPNFVRDLSDAKRSGMSFPEAIGLTSKSNYGKLTPEIEKMHNRLTWGTPFLRVLDIFGRNVSESKIINEALNLIRESYESGGNVASTLEAISRDMMMLREAESERESLIKQHVFIMYGVFIMFLGVAIMIIQVMVPMVEAQPVNQGEFGLQFSNPCEGVGFFPCNLYSGVGSFLGVPEGVGMYYTSLFFLVVVVQGLFTGLIAGQIGENSIISGVKHSLIMVFISIGVFLFMAKTGTLPF